MASIAPKLKHDVEGVLTHLGLSFSEAIELFLVQVKLNRGIPFEIKIPNKVTAKTLDDARKGKNLKKYKNKKEMFDSDLFK
jgi:DNA-damage-inducible protein J